jgi:hypothetical protein
MSLRQLIHLPDGSQEDHYRTINCGHCGHTVAAQIIAWYPKGNSRDKENGTNWVICPGCFRGSVIINKTLVIPSTKFGPTVEGLPQEIHEAYTEARNCMAVGAYTASELICRKILMHVAVDKGANEGDNFTVYLDHLERSGYITPPMKGWADLIRKNGNESTHKLATPSEERAESTVLFTAQLLRLVYEMEHIKNKFTSP